MIEKPFEPKQDNNSSRPLSLAEIASHLSSQQPADFTGATLTGRIIALEQQLHHANFNSANFIGTTIIEGDITGAKFESANINSFLWFTRAHNVGLADFHNICINSKPIDLYNNHLLTNIPITESHQYNIGACRDAEHWISILLGRFRPNLALGYHASLHISKLNTERTHFDTVLDAINLENSHVNDYIVLTIDGAPVALRKFAGSPSIIMLRTVTTNGHSFFKGMIYAPSTGIHFSRMTPVPSSFFPSIKRRPFAADWPTLDDTPISLTPLRFLTNPELYPLLDELISDFNNNPDNYNKIS